MKTVERTFTITYTIYDDKNRLVTDMEDFLDEEGDITINEYVEDIIHDFLQIEEDVDWESNYHDHCEFTIHYPNIVFLDTIQKMIMENPTRRFGEYRIVFLDVYENNMKMKMD